MHCQGHLLERRHTTVVFFIIIASRFFFLVFFFICLVFVSIRAPCLHIGLSLFHVDENVNDLNEMVHLFYK